jgi:small multidrug resistance pump
VKPNLLAYGSLLVAILFEVCGTTLLQKSAQFTRLWPSLGVVVCYGASFYFLSLTLSNIPVGIAYAIWSGLGIVLISAIGYFALGQRLDTPALAGLGLIVAGVLVINLLSKSTAH